MRKPLGQPDVPMARRGKKMIKIACNLFVSLEGEKKKKKEVGISQNLSFRRRKAIFLFSCSEKEYVPY